MFWGKHDKTGAKPKKVREKINKIRGNEIARNHTKGTETCRENK